MSKQSTVSTKHREIRNTSRLTPDFITFFAPAMLALLLQHVGVSLGSLAFVGERLIGTFDLYVVAPISTGRLLLGKYLAYTAFTLIMAGVVLAVLLWGLGAAPLADRRPLIGFAMQSRYAEWSERKQQV